MFPSKKTFVELGFSMDFQFKSKISGVFHQYNWNTSQNNSNTNVYKGEIYDKSIHFAPGLFFALGYEFPFFKKQIIFQWRISLFIN